MNSSETIAEDEPGQSVKLHDVHIACLVLILLFFKQCFPYLIKQRNRPDTCFGFRPADFKLTPEVLIASWIIGHIMVDNDIILIEINIIPAKTDNLSDPAARAKQYHKQGAPSVILRFLDPGKELPLFLQR